MNHIRIDYPGALHHVFIRGNNKQPIFLDADDYGFFLGRLKQVRMESGMNLYAAGLMTNHFHLFPETGPVPLKTVISRILTPYAMRFNKKHGRVGHLFYDRYKAKLCSRDGYFIRLLRYIHRNPVKAGMVKRPGDWPWSGHHDLVNGTNEIVDSAFPLSFFGSNQIEASRAYAEFVGDSKDDDFVPEYDDEFRLREDPTAPLTALMAIVAAEFELKCEELGSGNRARMYTIAKRAFALRGLQMGFSQADVARALKCTPAAVDYLRKQLND
jgi:REP element-mobilizing transposase RayT